MRDRNVKKTTLLSFNEQRRDWLKMMAGSAVTGVSGLLSACKPPAEEIVPYVNVPEYSVPGKPVFYSSMLTVSGYAMGVLVETHTGRPTKIEGNPQHPASLGATDIFSQAALVSLYDPQRARTISENRGVSGWDAFSRRILELRRRWEKNRGKGVHVLTTTVCSPVTAKQLMGLKHQFPELQWHEYEPVTRDHSREGHRLAYGETLDVTYRFEEANVVLSVDEHFLDAVPSTLRYAHDFSRRRQPEKRSMNRLYCIESRATPTGILADHRMPVKASDVENCLRVVANKLGIKAAVVPPAAEYESWLQAVTEDLKANAGKGIVIAGERQPPVVHALAQAINEKLGNTGKTVIPRQPVTARTVDHMQSLRRLTDAMRNGDVESLIILDGNPAYDTPADLQFAALLPKIPHSIHWSLYADETSALCRWHIPAAHELESWGDGRAFDGTASIRQPVVIPLFGGYSLLKVIGLLQGEVNTDDYALVRNYWKTATALPDEDFDDFWWQVLRKGFIEASQTPVLKPQIQWRPLLQRLQKPPEKREGLEITFNPDSSIWDGRYRHNPWLQELPKPVTSLTWDNAVLVNPVTADRLKIKNEDIVELQLGGRHVRAAVLRVSEQPEDTLALSFGCGSDGSANAFLLQTSSSPWFAAPLSVRLTGERYPLAIVQHHHHMETQQPVRHADWQTFKRNPDIIKPHAGQHPSLYPEPSPAPEKYDPGSIHDYEWAMSIDLNRCIGCNACTIACQAENNIPSVGKEEVYRGHIMHWIRIDHYVADENTKGPAGYFQPVPCMHCENAPCEYVCPVGATLHDSEGLNAMVYNRCIGTRDCSQNCPYKVRRFNWYEYNYHTGTSRALAPLRNPDVTVRSRGVMEKCTYCVQRISQARRDAKKENRAIRDKEVITACQAVCPTEAIVFGNLNDPDSQISREKSSPLDYGLLVELNTRPRTSYKAHIANLNPRLQTVKRKHE